ncbi:hypothetical protein PYCH_12400 [Pyrococcus yayanosii CH1]|uniref:Uncharacterized protein n=1 Tax=Pyrococcus yayanosii (strain CH1 / JCM 16557) TaxID=529709 RepID=F8AF90_PYRYC|nr:hypothetical protein PYCH_12400 [Pyrococcus yayanosii CH1]
MLELLNVYDVLNGLNLCLLFPFLFLKIAERKSRAIGPHLTVAPLCCPYRCWAW